MLFHGYSTLSMNAAVVVSIPKDERGDLTNSANYRGIALSSALGKLLEHVLLAKCKNELLSYNNQFAYNQGHGTTLCSYVMKETVNHFLN